MWRLHRDAQVYIFIQSYFRWISWCGMMVSGLHIFKHHYLLLHYTLRLLYSKGNGWFFFSTKEDLLTLICNELNFFFSYFLKNSSVWFVCFLLFFFFLVKAYTYKFKLGPLRVRCPDFNTYLSKDVCIFILSNWLVYYWSPLLLNNIFR